MRVSIDYPGGPDAVAELQAPVQRAYNGLCQVVLRSRPGGRGTGVLTVRNDGNRLPEATVRIRVR